MSARERERRERGLRQYRKLIAAGVNMTHLSTELGISTQLLKYRFLNGLNDEDRRRLAAALMKYGRAILAHGESHISKVSDDSAK